MHKLFLAVGALLGGIAVALGAFGAHGLKKIVPADTVNTFVALTRCGELFIQSTVLLPAAMEKKIPLAAAVLIALSKVREGAAARLIFTTSPARP